jgi:hypothetical protein
MVRASRAGVAARGHSGRVTKTDKFFLFEIVVWVCTTVLRDAECVNDLDLQSGRVQDALEIVG